MTATATVEPSETPTSSEKTSFSFFLKIEGFTQSETLAELFNWQFSRETVRANSPLQKTTANAPFRFRTLSPGCIAFRPGLLDFTPSALIFLSHAITSRDGMTILK